MDKEIIFVVQESAEGGYEAKTSGTTLWSSIKISGPSVRKTDTMLEPLSLLTLWPRN